MAWLCFSGRTDEVFNSATAYIAAKTWGIGVSKISLPLGLPIFGRVYLVLVTHVIFVNLKYILNEIILCKSLSRFD